MNETLMKLVVQNLAFLELSGNEIVNPDAAMREMENISAELESLTEDEKGMFIAFILKLARDEEAAAMPPERIKFILSIPAAVGLSDE